MQKYRVTARALNMRSKPVVSRKTYIATLPQGQELNLVAQEGVWAKVNTRLDGTDVSGWVHTNFIEKVKVTSFQRRDRLSSVHMDRRGKTTRDKRANAFPLNEDGMPSRDSNDVIDKVNDLADIIQYLDVENSKRYQPREAFTYCNIFAYDYCYLAHVYLPRVWWSQRAILSLESGLPTEVKYGQTVYEMSANSLFRWLKEFGTLFQWRRTFNMTELQKAANEGKVCVVSAHHKYEGRSGHISVVVPEMGNNKAVWKDGEVLKPLQCQAGRHNLEYFTSNWFKGNQFRGFSFWIHD